MEGIRDIYVSQGRRRRLLRLRREDGTRKPTCRSAVARDSLTFAAARQLYLDGRHAEGGAGAERLCG